MTMTDEQLTSIWKGLAPWMEDSPISPILLTFGRAVATAAVEAALREVASPPPNTVPLTDTYIQQVPDKCDRIVWRGRYYTLELLAAAPEEPT